MNDTRPVRRPPQSQNPSHRSNQSRVQRRRRRQQIRLFKRFLLIHQIVLVLVALLIGYRLGVSAGKKAAESVPTQPSGSSQTQIQDQPQPSGTTEPQGPVDTSPPKIMGVNKLSMFLGGTIAYRSGILLEDDLDPNPQLSVDSSQVNLSSPGTYPVTYTATDAAGNSSYAETTVTVAEAPDTYVDEAIIREKADKLLDKILTDGMTKEEQVNAIYDYIEEHHYYIADFDKTDYMQAAYLMMTENRGDCFGYYALSRLLFERLGIENLSVTRMKNDVRTTSHYWNMVSLDGGETWYHFDSTPHLTYPTRTCLITDADLEAFNELMPNYYYFDQASFPRTPTE